MLTPFILTNMLTKYPAILAVFAQVISAVIILSVKSQMELDLYLAAIIQGIFAAILARAMKLKWWWILINLVFVPALIFLSTVHLPRWSFLVGFVVLLLVNWNSLKDRVPLYLTGNKTQKLISEILKKQKMDFTFIDLGSGLAGSLYFLSKEFPAAKFFGVETAPLVFIASWFRCLFRSNCKIRYLSIWKTDLSQYDVVYCFLSPVPMPQVWTKAKSEMPKGSMLISNTFEIPGVKPSEVIKLEDWRNSKIIIWKL
jgi:hypothetical protein